MYSHTYDCVIYSLRSRAVILLPLRLASLTHKNPKRRKIITCKGMRSTDAKISLRMFIVEYPVRVISVAVLVAV